MNYFANFWQAIKTVAAGMRITLPYHFARSVAVQYPDVPPMVQERFRGFHRYEIERCIACEACAKACPMDCISMAKTAPRKLDKVRNLATGGLITKYQIDYRTCMFCAQCEEVCPTDCLHMGPVHDASCYDRADLLADFVELAKQGRRSIEPIWMAKKNPPAWVQERKAAGIETEPARRELMSQKEPVLATKAPEGASQP